MKHLRLASLFAALLAFLPSLAAAQQPPNAYGGPATGHFIVPNYYLLEGSFSKTLCTGTMAAGLAANAPVFSLRYTPSIVGSIAVINRVNISAGNAGTAFAAGVANFSLYAARSFSASDSGGTAGTLTGNNGKLKTSLATTAMGDIRVASTATLTAGTRTLDTDALGAILAPVSTTASISLGGPNAVLLDPKNAGNFPLQLANNEGFVIQATVPATGTWGACVFVEWDEYSQY